MPFIRGDELGLVDTTIRRLNREVRFSEISLPYRYLRNSVEFQWSAGSFESLADGLQV